MPRGILIAAMDFSNVPADEFNDWYDNEHIPDAATGSGFSDPPALDRRREPEAVGRDLRPGHSRVAKPGIPRNRRREPVALVEAG